MPLSVILALIIGGILRAMMKSNNDFVSDLGGFCMGIIFVVGIITLLIYKL